MVRSERIRFAILLLSSLTFYCWAGVFDFLIFVAVVLVTFASVWLARKNPANRPRWLYAGIAVLLLHLFVWKYLPWVGKLWGAEIALPLPLGLSFFTLQGVAYLVDFLRREADYLTLREFFLFKSFFPQLIAGPIVRAHEVTPYLRHLPRADDEQKLEGLFRIGLGMVKKLVIADHMAIYVETVFSNPSGFSSASLILGAMAFYFQIWGDFSGYTDIGRGCALLLGWRLPENFFSPVYALSPTEWARRWHVTLGRWMLLYVYVPVAGRTKEFLKIFGLAYKMRWLKQAFSLAITLIAVGLWHGASWNFLIYGLGLCFLFYCEMIIRRVSWLFKPWPRPLAASVAWAVFFPLELAMSVLFRCPDLHTMELYFNGILSPSANSVSLIEFSDSIIWRIGFVFVLEAVMYFDLRERRYPIADMFFGRIQPITSRFPRAAGIAAGLALAAVFVIALANRAGDHLSGFIYFRF